MFSWRCGRIALVAAAIGAPDRSCAGGIAQRMTVQQAVGALSRDARLASRAREIAMLRVAFAQPFEIGHRLLAAAPFWLGAGRRRGGRDFLEHAATQDRL